ncbi:MAG: substrate-binding domain-containing protein [Candidatus Bipolaricaulaceae bacterium]
MRTTSPTWIVLLGILGLTAWAQPTAPREALTVVVDGSSTVGPIVQAAAAEFSPLHPQARISVGISGTSGGFRRFLAGETDINNASRPIRPAEIATAQERDLVYLELLVGLDGVVVAVSTQTRIFRDGLPVLTLGELELLWSRESEGLVTRWSHLGSRFADAPLVLSGAASTSGTFDVFTAVVTGKEGDSRADYFGTEEDQLLAEQAGADPYALTYFGFAYLEHNRDRVQAVAIDPRRVVIDPPAEILAEVNRRRAAAGKAPLVAVRDLRPQGVIPDLDTIGSFRYPLSRPLFLYVNARSAQRPLLAAFVDYLLERVADPEFMLDVGYLPVSFEVLEATRKVWQERRLGTAFGGKFAGLPLEEIARLYRAHAGL